MPRSILPRPLLAGNRVPGSRPALSLGMVADRGVMATYPPESESAARPCQSNPVAVHLRATSMLYEGLKETSPVVLVSSSAVESMSLGALGGLASLDGNGAPPAAVGGSRAPLLMGRSSGPDF